MTRIAISSSLHQAAASSVVIGLILSATTAFAVDHSKVTADLKPPVTLSAEEDHRRMMQLLGIQSLREGANGRDPNAANAANYDEAKANPFPQLPDPLTLKSGKKVDSATTWWKTRRAEIVEDFDREMYGRMPSNTPKVNWEVMSTSREKHGKIEVIAKQLVGHVDNSSYPLIDVNIRLSLKTPANAQRPVAGNYLKYAGPLGWNDLPVDAHELIALCAPRPVFIGAGATNGDGWVDAKGMFMAAAAAGAVYKLLGKRDLGMNEFPPIETPLIDGDIAFRQHSEGHTPAPNWPVFLKFADRYMK
jgi:hypothetical protein